MPSSTGAAMPLLLLGLAGEGLRAFRAVEEAVVIVVVVVVRAEWGRFCPAMLEVTG